MSSMRFTRFRSKSGGNVPEFVRRKQNSTPVPRISESELGQCRALLRAGGRDDSSLTDSEVVYLRDTVAELARVTLDIAWEDTTA